MICEIEMKRIRIEFIKPNKLFFDIYDKKELKWYKFYTDLKQQNLKIMYYELLMGIWKWKEILPEKGFRLNVEIFEYQRIYNQLYYKFFKQNLLEKLRKA